eukprot:TRINITY_DN5422_c1_g2_i1.p1 TRINITY_DN5422_c1_g2~~TRINITY_DN5422_c1_g2_i1.p1  ORF type:complete len:423 (+),score=32.36 TRINITY_DN5422_c1_g2_i1:23-1291(+)
MQQLLLLIDKDPRILIEGHTGNVKSCACWPSDPNNPDLPQHKFVTVDDSCRVFIWDASTRTMLKTAYVGFKCRGVAVSEEEFSVECVDGWQPCGGGLDFGHHIAIGGLHGRIMILDAETMQPLMQRKHSCEAIDELKYSPPGGPKLLAAGSHDLKIYIYKVMDAYELLSVCVGHSGTIEHLDWSLPLSAPLKLKNKMILQSNDTSREILHWNPKTGKKITHNQRDTAWYSWTCSLGFDVMGIWEDFSDGTDINSVSRSQRGAPIFDKKRRMIRYSTAEESSDGVPGAGFLVTADDFSFVKLFNYPVVFNDAPYRCYRGHASHVMSIRFMNDDRRVISVGGHDRAVFQWRTCGINKADQDRDTKTLQRVAQTLFDKKQERLTLIPKTLREDWGPLDQTGKSVGPTADPLHPTKTLSIINSNHI